MTDTKHTPGPWTYTRNEHGAPGAPILFISCGDGNHPAHETRSYEERVANARLMAAAPDLLEALLLIERKYGSLADYADLPADKNALVKARAAIAKATE